MINEKQPSPESSIQPNQDCVEFAAHIQKLKVLGEIDYEIIKSSRSLEEAISYAEQRLRADHPKSADLVLSSFLHRNFE